MEQTLDFHFDLLADVRLAIVDDDHRAVGHVANALAFVLALANDFQAQHFAGEQDDFEVFGDLVKVHIADL